MSDVIRRAGMVRLSAVVLVVVVAAVGVTRVLMGAGGESSEAVSPTAQPPPATATATRRPSPTVEASPTPIAHAGILDGVAMSEGEWAARKDLLPLAVMLDNTPGANPHSGLDRADVVYEAFVEGGITRLMAVYWRQEAEVILPVRSARTPFVVWASELGAMYGHAGGAVTDNEANAVGQIAEWGVRDLNAFGDISSRYYYRSHDRYEPYNLGTSTASLREAAEILGFAGPPTVESWRFREPIAALPPGDAAGGIEIDFQGRLYAWQYIQWKWDGAAKRYLRFQFGGPHLDAVSGEQLAFATVVVMEAPAYVVDESGHVIYDQFGSGPATVFTGGQAYAGTWKKTDRTSRTRFFGADGAELVFERGPVFVEVVSRQSGFGFVADAGDLPAMPAYEPPPPGFVPEPDEPEPTSTPTTAPTSGPTAAPSSTPIPSPAASPTAAPTASASATAAGTVVPDFTRTPKPGDSASPVPVD